LITTTLPPSTHYPTNHQETGLQLGVRLGSNSVTCEAY